MTHITGLILTLWSIYSTCIAMPNIHKQMSHQQLQSIFHVDSVDSVPNYELVQLNHLGTEHNGELIRRRRSVNNNNLDGFGAASEKETHHVKKDLSKNPYYSELKLRAAHTGGGSANSVSDLSYSEKLKSLDLSAIKEHNVSFSAFGEVLNLTLRPTDGLFKNGPDSLRMWTVRSEPNATHGLALEEVLSEEKQSPEEIGQVFQDEENMAAILMRRHLQTGDLIMEGSIGHQMVIKPVPAELNPNQDEPHHVIFKRDTQPLEHLSDFAFMEPDDIETSERQKRSNSASASASASHSSRTKRSAAAKDETEQRSSRTKREAPYMIYPEILVIVDYDGYRLHGGDNLQVKRYFISFWNGVDLRYRLLKGPRIRISIAGIIISRGRDATPYLERNRVGRDAIDSAAALTDMGKYLFRERRLPVYDIAVAITKYDMCRRRKGGRCTKGTAGFAYVGGACVVNKRLEKVNSVAIIEDTGGFSGIIVAAHEVGHLLGAVHDGSPPPSYLGGPGAERCRWEDGYIMSDLRHTERGFRWSPCTVQSFHHFLNGDTASCLHNAPHEDNALGRSLPGTLLSLDAQCRRDRGTYACFKDERVCAQLFCFDAQTGYCVAYRPAAEGSSCGNGVHCLDGRCTPLPSNVIQDYGTQYRAVYNSAEQDFDDNNSEDYYENNDSEDEASSLDITGDLSSSSTSTTQSPPKTSTSTTTTTTSTSTSTTTPEPILTTTIETVRPLKLYRKIRLRNLSNNKTRTYLKHIKTTTSRIVSTSSSSTSSNSSSSIVINSTTPPTPANYSALRKTYDLYFKNILHKSKNHINSNRTSHSPNPPNYSSTTAAVTPPQTTTLQGGDGGLATTEYTPSAEVDSNETLDDTIGEPHRTHSRVTTTQRSYVLGGRSTTRSSLFDTYFRKRTHGSGNSSRHLNQQQQPQASPPAYTTNYLGDNTNNLPINIPRDRSSRSGRSTANLM